LIAHAGNACAQGKQDQQRVRAVRKSKPRIRLRRARGVCARWQRRPEKACRENTGAASRRGRVVAAPSRARVHETRGKVGKRR
jgi:hypothetical protein